MKLKLLAQTSKQKANKNKILVYCQPIEPVEFPTATIQDWPRFILKFEPSLFCKINGEPSLDFTHFTS